jgi:DNA replication protein DnaC
MRQLAPELLITAKTQRWAPEELLRTLIDAELAARDASNARTRMKNAAFPVIKTLDELDRSACSIPGPTLDYLASLEWITAAENLCLVGPAGTGKSHVLVALGVAAVQAGRKVRYFTAADLADTLYRGLADNSVGKVIDILLRNDLLLVDEVGFAPLDDTGAQLLFRFVSAAYERRSLGIASHWPFDKAHMFAATCAKRGLNFHTFGASRKVPTRCGHAWTLAYCLQLPSRDLRPCGRRCLAWWRLAGVALASLASSAPDISFASLLRPGHRCSTLCSTMRAARSPRPSANLVQKGLSAAIARAVIAATSFWAGWARRFPSRNKRPRR